jgi:Rod binding domain-containing protein
MDLPPLTRPLPAAPAAESLRHTAQELEAAFLAEMLSHAGLGAAEGPFSGGPGEDQFASFLRAEQARAIVQGGGIGLAEMIFRSLQEDDHATPA